MTTATLASLVALTFTAETQWLLEEEPFTKDEFEKSFPGVKPGDTFCAILPDGTVRVVEAFTHASWGNQIRLDIQSVSDWQREQEAEAARALQSLDCYGCGGITPLNGHCNNPSCGF
jgi:hypothetical protein